MTTFAHALADSLDQRWSEISLLISEAEGRTSNIDLYNALCRSVSVLMVAQFEGFMRDVAKAVVNDINTYSSFKESPSALKQTFCRSFLEKAAVPTGRDHQARVEKLIGTFDGLETKFVVETFLVKDVQDHNRNPSPSVIGKITENFGVRKFFNLIEGSDLGAVFSGTRPEIDELKEELKTYVIAGVKEHPYLLDPTEFNIRTMTTQSGSSSGKGRTFWETFLDNLMSRRNDIAHGTTSENSSSVEEIRNDLVKIQVLQLAILMVLCKEVTSVKPAPI